MFEFNLNLCLLPKPTNFTISLSSLYRPALVISCCTWRMWISGQFLHTLWPRLVKCSSYRHGGRRGTVPVFFLRKTLERLNGTVVVQTKEAVKVLSKSFKSFTQLEYASIFFFLFFFHSLMFSKHFIPLTLWWNPEPIPGTLGTMGVYHACDHCRAPCRHTHTPRGNLASPIHLPACFWRRE